MELPSLHRKDQNWSPKVLGEHALLLELEKEKLKHVHSLTADIETAALEGIIDVVPAYSSVTVIFDGNEWNHQKLVKTIENLPERKSSKEEPNNIIEIPVCYELGMDWEEVVEHTGLSKERIIEIHSSKTYTIAMMGFIPGFVFLDGLDKKLSTPRKSIPRTGVPTGSVGIGGNQTGIYSLESPGGWNIIGRSPKSFFDSSRNPPTTLNAGSPIKFIPISEEEFFHG